MSWDAVKEKLKAIIGEENTANPLNDDEIVAKLKDQGIDLARRTVAKYRKILSIPTARQRKTF
jgi:RNA polymerase sigma-54 factor